LLLALGASDRAPGGAGNLGNNAFFLVFGQVPDKQVIGALELKPAT